MVGVRFSLLFPLFFSSSLFLYKKVLLNAESGLDIMYMCTETCITIWGYKLVVSGYYGLFSQHNVDENITLNDNLVLGNGHSLSS